MDYFIAGLEEEAYIKAGVVVTPYTMSSKMYSQVWAALKENFHWRSKMGPHHISGMSKTHDMYIRTIPQR